jgi:hypothetical protein
MDTKQDFEQDLAAIRQLMERSVKFISFSGLSGILAGTYALLGAGFAYYLLPLSGETERFRVGDFIRPMVVTQLVAIAVMVLLASLLTGYWLSARRAERLGVDLFDEAGKRTFINLGIPLVSGGLFILMLLATDHYGLAAPSCLLFYGLALVNASPNLFDEVRYLGYSEIILGLTSMLLPGYGLYFWAFGFGVLHIVYGAVLVRKYEA